MLEGALILLAGIIIGRVLPGRRRRAPGPKPVCGCRHHHAHHDPLSGQCNAVTGMDRNPCTCRQYSGPVPLPEVYAPEIGS